MNFIYIYLHLVYNYLKGGGMLEKLKKYLKSSKKVKYFDEISSTNTVLKEMAQKGASENTILISEYQTQGRGRLGKSFFSPKGCGIYLSYLLKPESTPDNAQFLTVAAAVAIRRALISVLNIKTEIKWVNDIYFDNKKLCGILTEAGISSSGSLDYAILGIGLNIKTPECGYPEEFSYKTTNLESIKGQITEEKKWQLTAEFINIFDEIWEDKNRFYVEEYKEASCIIGKEIEILSGEYKGFAKAVDIDNNANLIVELKCGKTVALGTGDVSIIFNQSCT